jgi:ParB-like chromosome segregation protein Spo0J
MIFAEKIVMRRVADLVPYAKNARTHGGRQVAQIAASIKEFGFTNPVLIDGESGIIAGHGRVLGAEKLGLEEVPCIELAHLTPVQRRAYVIADNKLALNAGWNEELLAHELDALRDDGFELGLTGFTLGELEGLKLDDDESQPPASEKTWSVIVKCADEADQADLLLRLEAEGRTARGKTVRKK